MSNSLMPNKLRSEIGYIISERERYRILSEDKRIIRDLRRMYAGHLPVMDKKLKDILKNSQTYKCEYDWEPGPVDVPETYEEWYFKKFGVAPW